ncbi:DUF222 domain-containing protein [Iamia sp. SCSIO 61187]|uniref:DUF222 domain-containing protein n=1 Tax=Iamia sp. SCSIO 61187 TaxID=2722752 RepID=UPI001C62CD0E|nr:DUF222 domain-containing protein [Iamia sp. SCSIO 61187]QYG93373.1 DUF222 domain-containing protein [Iamia sp. SCSIO 61187]
MEMVCDPTTAEGLDALDAAVDRLQTAGVTPVDDADARALTIRLENVARRVQSLQIDLVAEIDRTGVHAADGHASAKVMVRHHANLSTREAARRAACAKALRSLPTVGAAFAEGAIGRCQVERIARAHANPRVRDAVEANEASFATEAATDTYRVFDQKVREWVSLLDEDGTRDRDQAAHDKRDARLHQNFDGGWEITGRCGSLVGAELWSIFNAQLKAETLADWDKARAEHGDAATQADLPRTDAQRRFDALEEIFRSAAAHHATSAGGSQVVTNVVIDQPTFEHIAARLAGIDPTPVDDAFKLFPAIGRRCSTLDGNPIEPTAAVAAALIGHIRRVVVGSDSVVIDLGRKSRLFTGPAALAVKLSSTTCYWPGCHVPVTDCQSDHLTPWSDQGGRNGDGGGSTNPRNGGPACGRHNRLRTHGYTTWRDPTGTWHITRPDGTEIT